MKMIQSLLVTVVFSASSFLAVLVASLVTHPLLSVWFVVLSVCFGLFAIFSGVAAFLCWQD